MSQETSIVYQCEFCHDEKWLSIPSALGYGQSSKDVNDSHLVPCPQCNDEKILSESEVELQRYDTIFDDVKECPAK